MKLTFAFVLLLILSVVHLNGQIKTGYSSSRNNLFTESQISNFESQIFQSPIDTAKADTIKEKLHSPKKAALMSALLPGLGQIYNRKYWKLGIIYPVMGGVVYGFGFNHKNFKVYRDALRIRYDDDPTTIDQFSLYSDDRIVTMKNYYQRYRDLCVIGFAAVYLLQVIDAAVDAHLYYFDVGPDLSLEWSPTYHASTYGTEIGAQMRFRF
jgi:hypothetical protein